MHSINILPNKPASVPDDSHVKDLDALKNVLSQFDLTYWQFNFSDSIFGAQSTIFLI